MSDQLPTFTAKDWVKVTGRGDIAVVTADKDYNIQPGDQIVVDEHEYTVQGLERFVKDLGFPQKSGSNFGIAVGKRLQ